MTSAPSAGNDRGPVKSIVDNGHAKTFLLSELVGRKVRTGSGGKLGKLKDLVFVDDPKYAEVTHLLVGRPFGDPSLKIPWDHVVEVPSDRIIVQEPPAGGYPEVGADESLLLLRDEILDKRVLDTAGFAIEVVYDIQLLLVENKLFVVAADVSRSALMRRIGFGKLGDRLPKDAGIEGFIPWKYVQALGPDLTATKGDVKLTVARDRLGEIHPEDLADILEELDREERIHLFKLLDSRAAAAALDATEPRVQRDILSSISAERVAQIFAHLSAVEISEVISILPRKDADDLLEGLGGDLKLRVQELLTQHTVPASVIASRRFLQFQGGITVADAFAKYRDEAKNSHVTMYVYVVDDDGHLKGVVDINELLQASPDKRLAEIMTTNVVTVAPDSTIGDLQALFNRYRFRAIPVVGREGRLVGVVREKDAFSTGDQIRLAR